MGSEMCIRDSHWSIREIVAMLGSSLGIEGATTAREMVARYSPQAIPAEPWVFSAPQ